MFDKILRTAMSIDKDQGRENGRQLIVDSTNKKTKDQHFLDRLDEDFLFLFYNQIGWSEIITKASYSWELS